MDAAGWIVAGYAAVVSTGSLGWQVYSWRLARKNRVEVTASAALLGMTDGDMIDAVSITVVNRSDHTVRVTGAGVELQELAGAPLQAAPHGEAVPQWPSGAPQHGSLAESPRP